MTDVEANTVTEHLTIKQLLFSAKAIPRLTRYGSQNPKPTSECALSKYRTCSLSLDPMERQWHHSLQWQSFRSTTLSRRFRRFSARTSSQWPYRKFYILLCFRIMGNRLQVQQFNSSRERAKIAFIKAADTYFAKTVLTENVSSITHLLFQSSLLIHIF